MIRISCKYSELVDWTAVYYEGDGVYYSWRSLSLLQVSLETFSLGVNAVTEAFPL